MTLAEGESTQLHVSGTDLPQGAVIRWESTNAAVAAVDADGRVRAVGAGSADVRVVASFRGTNRSDKAEVKVKGPPSRLSLTGGSGQQARVGQRLPSPVSVKVADGGGTPVEGVDVEFTAITPSGKVYLSSTVASDDAGNASSPWSLSTEAGSHTMTVSLAGVKTTGNASHSTATAEATAAAAEAVQFKAVSGNDQEGATGGVLADPVQARALDPFGNGVPGLVVSWSVPDGSGGLTGASTRTDSEGYATASWALGPIMGEQVIVATTSAGAAAFKARATRSAARRVQISGAAAPLAYIGETRQLHAGGFGADGNLIPNTQVRWATLSPAVVEISATGVVRATGSGTGRVVATIDGVTDTATVAVQQVMKSIAMTQPVVTLPSVGASAQLTAQALDAGGTAIPGAPMSWLSTASQAVSVDQAGRITAVAPGTAQVIAYAGDAADTATVTVPVSIAKVEITPNPVTLGAGTKAQLQFRAWDSNNKLLEGLNPSWASSSTSTATVSATGEVLALTEGKAQITATVGSHTASAAVTVSTAVPSVVASLTVSPQVDTIRAIGHSTRLIAQARDADGNLIADADITWSSLNPTVAVVSDGTVTGKAMGTALIVAVAAACSSCADTVGIAVFQQPVAIEVSSSSLMLAVGSSSQLSAVVRDANGVPIQDMTVQWSSSNPEVAEVSASGLVTAHKEGSTVLSAVTATLTASVAVTAASSSVTPDMPELPRVYVDTRVPNGTRVVRVPAGGDLQGAINSARRGDIIELDAGATYRGPFTLPAKSGSGWVTIRSSDHARLPENVRVSPSQRSRMATLEGGAANERVLKTAEGATHWHVVGIEIRLADNGLPGVVNSVVDLVQGSSHVILDRTYIHGRDGQSLQRCVIMNNAHSAVINSWLDRCHAKGYDSQAIVGWSGPGPYKIVNNYLAGAGENIMFGGARIRDGDVPSDIEIRRNHLHKPLSWQGVWTVKNSFELKMAERVLFEGNIVENNWADAQTGYMVVIKSENLDQSTLPNIAVRDVVMRYNRFINSRFGINIIGGASSAFETGDGRTKRILVEHNELELTDSRGLQFGSGLDAVSIRNNTWLGAQRVLIEGDGGRLVFANNISGDVKGSGLAEGTASFARWTSYSVTGNAFVGRASVADRYPAGNSFPTTVQSAPSTAGANRTRIDSETAGVRSNP